MFLNDIAIFILSEPVEFTDNVQPACLPNPDYGSSFPLANVTAYASGWVKK